MIIEKTQLLADVRASTSTIPWC